VITVVNRRDTELRKMYLSGICIMDQIRPCSGRKSAPQRY
jgi:hypothetical protein